MANSTPPAEPEGDPDKPVHITPVRSAVEDKLIDHDVYRVRGPRRAVVRVRDIEDIRDAGIGGGLFRKPVPTNSRDESEVIAPRTQYITYTRPPEQVKWVLFAILVFAVLIAALWAFAQVANI